jgi:quinol monooxygenase YgiN
MNADGAGVAKFAIVGTIEIEPGRKEQFLPLLMAHRARCLKDEPGTLQFNVMAPHDDDAKLLMCEIYQDAGAFDVHRNGPSNAQFRKETAGMVAKMSFTRCSLVE